MRISDALALGAGLLLAVGQCGAAELPHTDVCADVQVGTEHIADLDCINQKLRTLSARQPGAAAMPPIDPHPSSIAVGTANQAAARQMMGNAFGVSAQPQRPHPVFIAPLTGGTSPLPTK